MVINNYNENSYLRSVINNYNENSYLRSGGEILGNLQVLVP